MPDLVVFADMDGRITAWNPAAAAFFGSRISVGQAFEDLLGTATAPGGARRRMSQTVARGVRSWSGGADLLDNHGEAQPFSCVVDPGPDGVMLLAREAHDLRAREAAERELEARDEFVAR